MSENGHGLRHAGWQIDLGAGNRVDAEFGPGGVWFAIGSKIDGVNAWMKGVDGIDVRIGIERRPDGVVITFDRGDNQPAWWPERGPEITLRIDRETRTASVTARGPAHEGKEVLLAQTEI
jgi:hypothetical protein